MGINIPENANIIFDRVATDFKAEIEELDPYLRNSLIRALLVGNANAFFELYKTLQELERLTFWDTTDGESLERWASIYGITRNPASIATGFVVFTGIDTSNIPIASQFTSTTGNIYETTSAATITDTTLSVLSITRAANTATVTTSANHGFASNMEVTMASANETDYNGTFVITVISPTAFSYTVENSPTTPATGTITVNASYATVPAQSQNTGSIQNLESGEEINLSVTLAGVDGTGYVAFDEIAGGTDQENDDDLRDRFLFRIQNPIANFNANDIISQARTVPGVTRVWVQSVDDLNDNVIAISVTRDGDFAKFTTASPHGLFDGQIVTISGANESDYNVVNQKILVIDSTSFGYLVKNAPTTPATGTITAFFSISSLGQVRIFFTRDNDDDPIPTPLEAQSVKDEISKITPATISASDVIVSPPTEVTVDFTFTELNPNTSAMQQAITANLTSYFSSNTDLAKSVKSIDYEGIINSTLDSGGNSVQSFALSSPTGDISVGPSELALLGTIVYP
jgi:uncharacterized phage protein gp47/JayE